jgi:hypothetical protein
MFTYNSVRYSIDENTGTVTATGPDGFAMHVTNDVGNAARYTAKRQAEAFGYACAMQDAMPDGRDTYRANEFAEAFAAQVFAQRIDAAYHAMNVADAWATWRANRCLDVDVDHERLHRRPIAYTANQVRNGTWPPDARFIELSASAMMSSR